MGQPVLIHHQKFYIAHKLDIHKQAVVELKIWKVSDKRYPERIKYSLFCIDLESKKIIVGMDNHHPKGHHIHLNEEENIYFYTNPEQLIEDFFILISKAGFNL